MDENYWIVDDWLIFKPEFNEELNEYYDIINKYKKIMFINYNEPLIAIKLIIYGLENIIIILLEINLIKK